MQPAAAAMQGHRARHRAAAANVTSNGGLQATTRRPDSLGPTPFAFFLFRDSAADALTGLKGSKGCGTIIAARGVQRRRLSPDRGATAGSPLSGEAELG